MSCRALALTKAPTRLIVVATLFGLVPPPATLGGDMGQRGDDRHAAAADLCIRADESIDRIANAVDTPNGLITRQSVWRAAIEKFREASELWRGVGDVTRQALALERIRNLYENLGEGASSLIFLDRELEVWRRVGNKAEQARLLRLRAGRAAVRDKKQAVAYYEQSIAIARSGNEYGELRQSLYEVSFICRELGDEDVARSYERELDRVRKAHRLQQEAEWRKIPPVAQPRNWSDLASSPLKLTVREIDGRREAGVANQSSEAINCFRVGCIINESGKVRVVSRAPDICIDDGVYSPGDFIQSAFEWIANPSTEWSEARPSCGENARWAVVEVLFVDGGTWSADGAIWPHP